ncbi:MAG: site-specific DNA-methyltransferase [Turicibacter sp.]|nr:site-specific DNA-methyltransferase [Turicibacter sp.]
MIDVESITNTIINDDCINILKQLPDKCIDLVFTDPPYKQEYKTSYGTEKTITRENYSKIGDYGSNSNLDFTEFFDLVISKLRKINIFIFCDKETKFDFMIMAKNKGFSFREIPFCKTSPTPFCNNQWLPDVEWGLHIYNDLEVMGNYETKQGWFTMPNFKEPNIDHPTPKKISIISKILKNISTKNDLILDCFSGSGTTAVACHNLKRRFICIEKDKDYWKASVERLKNTQAQMKLF